MGKIISYRVILYPVSRDRGFLVTKFEIGSNKQYPTCHFDADSVPAMLEKVKAFATSHGEPCRASVYCDAPRKPAGFDKATKDLYFNLEQLGGT